MKKYVVYLIFLVPVLFQTACTQQAAVQIMPDHPKRGQRVTITYRTQAPSAKIPQDADQVQLVFTYSTLYELPYVLNMEKKGADWQVSFVVPRYFTYATFYFKSDSIIDQPAPDRHYFLAAYTSEGKRVKNGFLYEAYSLPAQMGRADSLGIKQEQLYKKELENYPNNYEAKLRLLKYQIRQTNGKKKEQLTAKANELIAQQFNQAPTEMNNINLVTMGYLILGEKSRLDSIRKIVMEKYPHSGAAKEFLASFAAREPDTDKRVTMLENALKDEQQHTENKESYNSIHTMLFDYYVTHHQKRKALYHAREMAALKNPYRPATLKEIAEKLTQNDLALDTALHYADVALKVSDSFPVGIIRYFPAFGYIPSYVNDSVKEKTIEDVKGNLLSLKGLIYAQKGNGEMAEDYAEKASEIAADSKTLQYIAQIYERFKRPEKAIAIYQKMLLISPSDSIAKKALKTNYERLHHSDKGFDALLLSVNAAWKRKTAPLLNKKRLNIPLPEIDSLVDMKGQSVNMNDLKGKVIIMDFWATWCVPCMHEMPFIQKVYDQYKNNPDVVFMIINSGANNTLEDAQKWQKRMPYTFPVYYTTDRAIGEKMSFNVIPALFVIDKKNTIQFKTIGFEGPDTAPLLDLKIEILLKK